MTPDEALDAVGVALRARARVARTEMRRYARSHPMSRVNRERVAAYTIAANEVERVRRLAHATTEES